MKHGHRISDKDNIIIKKYYKILDGLIVWMSFIQDLKAIQLKTLMISNWSLKTKPYQSFSKNLQ